jgi:hypothetical protein
MENGQRINTELADKFISDKIKHLLIEKFAKQMKSVTEDTSELFGCYLFSKLENKSEEEEIAIVTTIELSRIFAGIEYITELATNMDSENIKENLMTKFSEVFDKKLNLKNEKKEKLTKLKEELPKKMRIAEEKVKEFLKENDHLSSDEKHKKCNEIIKGIVGDLVDEKFLNLD